MPPPVSRSLSSSSTTQSPPIDVDERLSLYLSEDEEKRKINKIASDIVSFSEENVKELENLMLNETLYQLQKKSR